MPEEPLFEQSYEEHKHAQQLRLYRETTPAQRLAWLEDALRLVYASGIDYLEQKRRLQKPAVQKDEPIEK
jgi:hypothetical protein